MSLYKQLYFNISSDVYLIILCSETIEHMSLCCIIAVNILLCSAVADPAMGGPGGRPPKLTKI